MKMSWLDWIKYYILLLLFKLLSFLPLRLIRNIGKLIGVVAYKSSKNSSRRLRENLLKTGMCTQDEVEVLALKCAQNLGMMLVETMLFAWQKSKKTNAKRFSSAKGQDLVFKELERKNPVLLLTPHIGNFDVCVKHGAYSFAPEKLTVLYKPDKKQWWNKLMLHGRSENNIIPVPTNKKGVLSVLKALKEQQIVGILPDSVASQGDGVWTDFFGNKVFATTLSAKLALMPKVKTFIAASYRNKNGFEVEYVPFTPTSNDIAATVQEIYVVIEQFVLKHKEQFYWSYNRFRVPDHAKGEHE